MFKVFAKKVLTEPMKCGTLSRQRGGKESHPRTRQVEPKIEKKYLRLNMILLEICKLKSGTG